jgi:hypothetical protein
MFGSERSTEQGQFCAHTKLQALGENRVLFVFGQEQKKSIGNALKSHSQPIDADVF